MTNKYPKKIKLACLPTPLHELERLSKHLGGPRIYIKRDDLTGCALSGNKVRKLEFSLAEALRQKVDTVITTGGIQSNHCRATAVAAASLGLKSLLFLRGTQPEAPQGNVLLDVLAGAEIRWITPEQYLQRDEIMRRAAEEIGRAGGRAYVIPEGASHGIGSLGYVKAAAEIAGQCRKRNLKFDAIYSAIGSGGTTAGLALGFPLAKFKLPVRSVSVCDDRVYFNARVRGVMENCIERFGLKADIRKCEFEIIDGYKGPGYALPCKEVIETIRLVARLEGIILDPVYTGKAMWGLLDRIKRGEHRAGRNVLFLYTGGIFDIFAFNRELGLPFTQPER